MQRESGHFLFRDGHDRGAPQTIHCVELWLIVVSFQYRYPLMRFRSITVRPPGYLGHNARQSADSADTSNPRRKSVGVDATLLGPELSFVSRGF